MSLNVLDPTTRLALTAAASQQAQCEELVAAWAGGNVTVLVYGSGGVLRDTVTLAPFAINTGASPRRVECGTLVGRDYAAAGDVARLLFRAGGTDIFSIDASSSGGASVNFAGVVKALCAPRLAGVVFTADAALPAVTLPSWRLAMSAGSIANIPATNDRQDINPRFDAALNPDAPAAAPWEASIGWDGDQLSEFCGALYCKDWGAAGKYVMWGAPGHSTNLEYAGWVAFDVASETWEIVDASPPVPTTATLPPSSQCDQAYGEWIGDSADWAAPFRRPGYNPPFGSHTRNSFVYIPAQAAGNASGKIVVGWNPTLNSTGLGLSGGWVYDCDTGFFSRTTNVRPGTGSAVAGLAYHSDQGVVIGYNRASSGTVSELDYLDLATLTWTRRNATSAVAIAIDTTCLVVGDLFVYVANTSSSTGLRAAPVSTVKAGGSWAWSTLTLSAPTLPLRSGGSLPGMLSCHWERCPVNGAWYAVDRNSGSLTLWKLEKPAGVADSDTAGLLAGTWTVSSETLTGDGLEPAVYDYRRLQWCDSRQVLLWVGDLHTSNVQAILPSGL